VAELVADLAEAVEHGAQGLAVHLEGEVADGGELAAALRAALHLQLDEAGGDGHAREGVGRGLDVDAPVHAREPGHRHLRGAAAEGVGSGWGGGRRMPPPDSHGGRSGLMPGWGGGLGGVGVPGSLRGPPASLGGGAG
jgi:hypothetical protein